MFIKNQFDMIKITLTLVFTVLGVLLPSFILWVFAAVNVLTIGIIHGANDLYILSKIRKTSKKTPFGYLFITYVFFVFSMVLALYRFPQWALLLFVLASAFHFGEQQWHQNAIIKSAMIYLFYAAFGLLLFSSLFYFHDVQTASIIVDIAQIKIPETFFVWLLGGSIIVTLFSLFFNLKQLRPQLFFQTVAFLSILLLFSQTSLLWSFAVYFVLWHSIPSLKEQAIILYPDQHKPIHSYIKAAMPYWILSVIGLTAAVLFLADQSMSLLALFFAFLAAITIPHVLVIFFMHKKYIP